MDFDLSLDDMQLAAYRLSWPATEPKDGRARRLARAVHKALHWGRLEGWPVALSAPESDKRS